MRVSKVPVDMSSEQKEFFGVISKRQAVYLLIGGMLLYSYIPAVFKFLMLFNIAVAVLGSVIASFPVAIPILILGFLKVEKYGMNRDFYYFIRIMQKTQYGLWRKGS